MTGADFAGQIIDRLLERRYGAPGSRKWWKRLHAAHGRMVMLSCPFCPDAAELRRMIYRGPVIASAADFKAAAPGRPGRTER